MVTEATPVQSLREAFGDELARVAADDDRIVLLDGDLANSTKADTFAAQYPERFIECGIAEQNMIGMAAGLATLGYRPWVSSFAAFLTKRALDQVDVSVTQPGLPVVLVGGYAGVLNGRNGKTHHALFDYGVMRSLPGMVVIAPCDAVELRLAIRAIAELGRPCYLRITRDPSAVVTDPAAPFVLGDPVVLRGINGEADVVLVSTGVQSTRALEAANLLAARGLVARVVHLPTIAPLNPPAVLAHLDAGLVVAIEDHSRVGGLGSLLAELVTELGPRPVVRLGVDSYTEAAPNEDLLALFSLTAEAVASTVEAMVRKQ